MSLSRIDFHSAYQSGRMTGDDGKPMTLAAALDVIFANPAEWHEDFGKWRQIKGFKKWFSRPPVIELSRTAALLVESATNCLYRILESDDPKMASAQVQATRTALELANAFPKKTLKIETMDDSVRTLSDAQKRQLVIEAAKSEMEVPDSADS
jgi:hypothetical protein